MLNIISKMNVIRASILKLADSEINFNTVGLHEQ